MREFSQIKVISYEGINQPSIYLEIVKNLKMHNFIATTFLQCDVTQIFQLVLQLHIHTITKICISSELIKILTFCKKENFLDRMMIQKTKEWHSQIYPNSQDST